uniref:Uncharacterized protein n=1 Tax=Lepeophtheirus salmonis TaxID=72036 RepID=A0A0K2TN25_LEPSM
MVLPAVDRCAFFFLAYSDIFIVGLTLEASMMFSGFTLVGLPPLGLLLRLSPLTKRFLIPQTVALLTFKAFGMSKIVLPARFKLLMMALLASIATYTGFLLT